MKPTEFYETHLQELLKIATKITDGVTGQRLYADANFQAFKALLEKHDRAVNDHRNSNGHDPMFQSAMTEALGHLNDPEGIERSRNAIEEALEEFERRERPDDTDPKL